MLLNSIVKGKCPNCKKGKIFGVKGNLLLFQIPQINDRCENCNFKFEREPGFFFGAMFVSYGLAVAQFIATFVVCYFLLGLSVLTSFFGVIIAALLFSTINFRLSRIIWIYLFSNKKVEVSSDA